MATLEDVIALSTLNGRICPQPQRWNDLYEKLPSRRRSDMGWEPPLPLILGAWWDSDDEQKAQRFRTHLQWAQEHGVLGEVHRFLAGLREADWHHAGQ